MTFCASTMSTSFGWEIQSPQEALALHFTYWFTSRCNQGKVLGNVPSFYYLWEQYGKNQDRMVEETKNELDAYIKELFPRSKVAVTFENVQGHLYNYVLIITAQAVHGGQVYDLAQTVLVTGEGYKVLDQKRPG